MATRRRKRTVKVRICAYCGKEFVTKSSRKYCSRECSVMAQLLNAKDTICWNCKKATGGCSWSDKLIPVDGWEAIPTRVKMVLDKVVDSYKVIGCPLFEQD